MSFVSDREVVSRRREAREERERERERERESESESERLLLVLWTTTALTFASAQYDMDNHEHFLAVGKSCSTSAAAMELIRTATAEPGMIAFEELSELPAVRALQDSDSEECRKYFKLLTIFRHGTWSTYRSSQSELPELSPAQEVKLRQLSLISLAEQKKVLPYSVLQEELQLSQVRDIEDFLIDCMVLGLLNGKLDQKQRHLEVEYSKARDVR